MEKQQITFKDLSVPLKIGIVGGIADIVLYILFFLAGFLSGL